MPNPKLGTVTSDIPKAVSNSMKGEVVIKTAKDGGVDVVVGKVSMGYIKVRSDEERRTAGRRNGRRAM